MEENIWWDRVLNHSQTLFYRRLSRCGFCYIWSISKSCRVPESLFLNSDFTYSESKSYLFHFSVASTSFSYEPKIAPNPDLSLYSYPLAIIRSFSQILQKSSSQNHSKSMSLETSGARMVKSDNDHCGWFWLLLSPFAQFSTVSAVHHAGSSYINSDLENFSNYLFLRICLWGQEQRWRLIRKLVNLYIIYLKKGMLRELLSEK